MELLIPLADKRNISLDEMFDLPLEETFYRLQYNYWNSLISEFETEEANKPKERKTVTPSK